MKKVHLSNGSSYKSQLVVYRDWVESNGRWRLFWADLENPYMGVNEQSTATGDPFFATQQAAIAHGERHYGEIASIAAFHHN